MAPAPTRRRAWIRSTLLLLLVLGAGAGLAAWKLDANAAAAAAARQQPEPMMTVALANAGSRPWRRTTTAIGTVIALRSITLHNELPGTVRTVALEPGALVEPGTVLVALDVAVEQAELRAQEAEAALAASMLDRMERASQQAAASAIDVERARSQHDVALAHVQRLQAVIERKTIRAPFRARVGLADVHIGQYLEQGTQLTTLQGIDDAVHVDFTVTQVVAATLRPGQTVEVVPPGGSAPCTATIVALDARVDPTTRNATIRARIEDERHDLAPGASVRVRVPVGEPQTVVTVPVSALRKGPAGDHVWVIATAQDGRQRAERRIVRSGTMLGDDVVIHEGLQAGEPVAAAGSFKLFDNVLVAVAAPPADAASTPPAVAGDEPRGH